MCQNCYTLDTNARKATKNPCALSDRDSNPTLIYLAAIQIAYAQALLSMASAAVLLIVIMGISATEVIACQVSA